jgi:HJR/Mrr/RecB family endonuclease
MSFAEAYGVLVKNGPTSIPFQIQYSTTVDLWASEIFRGERKGEKVIRVQWSRSTSIIGQGEWGHELESRGGRKSGLLRHLQIAMASLLVDQIKSDSDAFQLIIPETSILISENWKEITKAISMDSKLLYQLSWEKFEDLMARVLESFGWTISPLARTKDGGVDIIATRIVLPDVTFRMMVQCKKYSEANKVGVDVIKNVWATKWDKGFHHAMIATTSTFTSGATEYADQWKFEMRDHDLIHKYCVDYYDRCNGNMMIANNPMDRSGGSTASWI